jgi:prefoldin subunit 5
MNTALTDVFFSLIVGVLGVLFRNLYPWIMRRLGKEVPTKTEAYSQKLARLTASLTEASKEVDGLLAELVQVARQRESAARELEKRLTELEGREAQLQRRIADLQNTPVPVAEHFAALIQPGEKRSAWRDYSLFVAGVVVSTIVGVILQVLL